MTLATGKTLTTPKITLNGKDVETAYALLNSPNFTGTLQSGGSIVVAATYSITSPTINATSSLQINGVGVNPYGCGRVLANGSINTRANGQLQGWTVTHTHTPQTADYIPSIGQSITQAAQLMALYVVPHQDIV